MSEPLERPEPYLPPAETVRRIRALLGAEPEPPEDDLRVRSGDSGDGDTSPAGGPAQAGTLAGAQPVPALPPPPPEEEYEPLGRIIDAWPSLSPRRRRALADLAEGLPIIPPPESEPEASP